MNGPLHRYCYLMDRLVTDLFKPGVTNTKFASGVCTTTNTTPQPEPLNGIAQVTGMSV